MECTRSRVSSFCAHSLLFIPQRSFSFLNVPFCSSTFLNFPFCSSTFLFVPQYFYFSCGGKSFGKQGADAWTRRMQYAEGPKAFEIGCRKMLEDFGTDLVRTRYINSLYNDDQKAHFKRNLQFSNAVLVDMCEILFRL